MASTRDGDVSLVLPGDDTRYLIAASAQREDRSRVEVESFPDAGNQITVESPGGQVRITKRG
ncbi:hypothetical protein [Streptoalloteichus hindustanus]|uniref:hypothetical protein n=1 Tax=Streptoalloteichus hindustanus TaxID=2017 RepID=UPI000936E9E8|nr:hypothetical protein [Streptoalloteichus hindustanus]